MRKIFSLILALALATGILAGCGEQVRPPETQGKEQSTKGAAEEAIEKNTDIVLDDDLESVVIDSITRIDAAPANLDPTAMNTSGAGWLWEVYEMFYQLDGFGGELVPHLADPSKGNFKPGMDHEEGSNEYIVYLKEGIVDHAGNKITSSDVVFSYNHIVNSGHARGMGQYEKAEVVDEYATKITFKRELNLVGELTTFFARVFIISEKAFNDSPSGLVSDACGTGSYKLEEFVTGSKMVLKKNADYWCKEEDFTCPIQAANVEKIEIIFVQENASQIVALQTGEADIDSNLSLADAGDFVDGGKYDDKFNVFTYWDNLTNCILPNCHEDALTGNPVMRKALFYAISVEGVTAGLSADVPGAFRECYGMGNPNFPDFSESWATWDNYQTKTDLELAKQYLAEAGYNGETIRIIAMAGDSETIAVILTGMLEQVGVKSEINLVDRTSQGAVKGDPTAWDLSVEAWASSDFVVNVWDKLWKSANEQGYIAESNQYIKDDEFLQMCLESKTIEGHNQEIVDKIQKHIIENAYAMGLSQKCGILIYPTYVKGLYLTDKNAVVVGACTYNEKQ
ncbi:MAG: ABC transporter substrate-binding protein [Lachnospiraceae bacterium]|jgi:ABC-type transport system substrate-binding protein